MTAKIAEPGTICLGYWMGG